MDILTKLFSKKDNKDLQYASSSTRSLAGSIDMMIVLILRLMAVQICAKAWYEKQTIMFSQDFYSQFGTNAPKSTKAHVDYILGHQIVTHTIILIAVIVFVGVIYYTFFNSSKWQATPGKRLLNITMIKNNDKEIDFITAFIHYLLSIIPYIFFLYIAFYKIHNEISLYEAITTSRFNLMFGILLVLSIQIQIFTKKKVTFYDMICSTTFKKGKTNNKYPW